MLPPLPVLEDYGISPQYGFLPNELPLERLPDPYYNKWEAIVANLQGLILSQRLRPVIEGLPVLSTAGLEHDSEWRRAYSLLSFMAHGYIWGGYIPAERLPASISVPWIHVAGHLEIPPVATYAATCLWNFKPLFVGEGVDRLDNLATLTTFTGSIDESWFYLVSVAIEARAAPSIALMLDAIKAVRANKSALVTTYLLEFAKILDDIGDLLQKMHDGCDPHIFYNRIRPFLAGSQNMAESGLPNGVMYENEKGARDYRKFAGGSNAQSSVIQFFDIVLGIMHRPTGEKPNKFSASKMEGVSPPSKHNFLQEMRKYMPGPHRRFLEDITRVANIREYVETHQHDKALSVAFDSCIVMLQRFRNLHIDIVTRYIATPARLAASSQSEKPDQPHKVNIATASRQFAKDGSGKKDLKGTGGTDLIRFLKQARDETAEPAVEDWVRLLLKRRVKHGGNGDFFEGKLDQSVPLEMDKCGLAGTWTIDEEFGGLCHY